MKEISKTNKSKDIKEHIYSIAHSIIDEKIRTNALGTMLIFINEPWQVDENTLSSKMNDGRFISIYYNDNNVNITYICNNGLTITNIIQSTDENKNTIVTVETKEIYSSSSYDINKPKKKNYGKGYSIESKTVSYDSHNNLTCEAEHKVTDRYEYRNDRLNFTNTFSCFNNIVSDRRKYYLGDDNFVLLSDVSVNIIDKAKNCSEYYGIFYGDTREGYIFTQIDKELFDRILTQEISLEEAKKLTAQEVTLTLTRFGTTEWA